MLDFALSVIESNELDLLVMLSVHLLDIILDVQDALLSNVLEADSAGKLRALAREHAADDKLNSPTGLDVGFLHVRHL